MTVKGIKVEPLPQLSDVPTSPSPFGLAPADFGSVRVRRHGRPWPVYRSLPDLPAEAAAGWTLLKRCRACSGSWLKVKYSLLRGFLCNVQLAARGRRKCLDPLVKGESSGSIGVSPGKGGDLGRIIDVALQAITLLPCIQSIFVVLILSYVAKLLESTSTRPPGS